VGEVLSRRLAVHFGRRSFNAIEYLPARKRIHRERAARGLEAAELLNAAVLGPQYLRRDA
jgi:hypothetical protein